MNNDYTDSAPPPEAIDEEALRKRLINRIAIAGVAIVALLGGLAVIDSLYVPSPLQTSKITAPILVTEVTKPVEGMALSATASTPVTPPAAIAPEPPQPEAIPTIESTGEPEETTSISAPVHQEKPSAPKGVATEPIASKAKNAVATSASPSRPLTQPQTKPVTQDAPHFVLQMGVFKNADNAQELLAKLQKNGIPAQIESRVQVGPFNTKAEANEARTKLKAMGLDAGMLMATHR